MDRVRRVLGCDTPEAASYSGAGICVAVLDSGIVNHPDLNGRIIAFRDFTTHAAFRGRRHSLYDDNGHGTHVSGILAGNGLLSKGKYKGIADKSLLVCGKVLDKKGGGSLKNLLNGLRWLTEIKEKYDIRILNISIEIESEENIKQEELKQLKEYFELLWSRNVLIVVSAGNKGPNPMTISPIGECGSCICVGCNDEGYIGKNGRSCGDYSGRGPGKQTAAINSFAKTNNSFVIYNPLKKPDIVAPGTDIVACHHRYNISPYISKSGTSMSAPIVSGACALCLEKYKNMSNNELRRILLNSAKDLGKNWNVQGAGLLQIKEMLVTVTS